MVYKNKVNILQIGMTKNIGGMESYLMAQYRKMNKEKIHYDFINLTEECPLAFEDELIENKSKIFSVPTRRKEPLKHYWKMIKTLFRERRNYRYIVLNTCHLYYIFPLFIAKLFGIPNRIIHSHNGGDEIKISSLRKVLISINKLLMKFSVTDYWACSKLAGEWMFGKKRKFKVIHNAIDVDKFKFDKNIRDYMRKQLNIKDDQFVVGHVGRFSYQKNHLFLIDIFNEIVKIKPNAVLLLIGDAVVDDNYLIETKQKVKRLGLDSNVKFLGLRKDTNRLYQAMDCFVLPSRFEGLPVVGIEAQTAGLSCFFADTITDELKITDLVDFIPLDKSLKFWAEKVIKKTNEERIDMSSIIQKAGYDIKYEVSKLENYYRSNVSE